MELYSSNELFGNVLDKDELKKVSDYYSHQNGWTNRLIQGDSLLVMTSLLEREGMAEKVQCIYIDPPYGINYSSNWQGKISDSGVKVGNKDENLSGEPETIKAYRDTWELGIHSYLSYLRDRLIVAKQLLKETGSCFVQISDENLHLVRCLMDEVFGSENFMRTILYRTRGGNFNSTHLEGVNDYLLWYSKNKDCVRYTQLFGVKNRVFDKVELEDGTRRAISKEEKTSGKLPKGSRTFIAEKLEVSGRTESCVYEFEYNGKKYKPRSKVSWGIAKEGMEKLSELDRLYATDDRLYSIRYHDDFPVQQLTNMWTDTGGERKKEYVVQTNTKVLERCILMCTDPGDLVLDPTCGSGTSAYVAEQWGRRWITIDTSRIALNIAKFRLMTATYPYYYLYSDVVVDQEIKGGKIKKEISEKPDAEKMGDIRQGFVYEEVPHITMKSLAKGEPFSTETLYDKPCADKEKLRVTGPYTVETLQNYEPISPDKIAEEDDDIQVFEQRIFEHLKASGVRNGIKGEQATFVRVERLTSTYINAEGYYNTPEGEKKAYFHIGPKFGTVSKVAVNEAVKECRQKGDVDWLIILGFSFEDGIETHTVSTDMGIFHVTRNRINDDLMQDGLLKKDKKAGSFITIGEPDIKIKKGRSDKEVTLEICGLDIYDPIKGELKARDVSDIAFWMVDDNYDGSNFVINQVFFCGGNKFDDWKKKLNNLAKDSTKRNLEKTLKIEIDDEAFERVYGFQSHPIIVDKKDQKAAVRVVSQFGEESTKIIPLLNQDK